ncbi:MAG: hypothetical protein IIZ73_00590 [Ruminococcus sp.]|nr:hypothetical protein [Ruminococcus sp.]
MQAVGLASAFNIGANIGAYAAVNETARERMPSVVEKLIRGVIVPNKDALKYILSAK